MLVSCFESKRIACRKSLLGVLLHYVGSTSLSVTKSHWRHIYIIYQRNLTWESVFSVIYHPSAESDLRERIFRNIHLFAKSDLRTYFQSHASTSGVSPWERIFIHIHPSAEFDLKSYFQSYSMNIFLPSADFEQRTYFQSHSWRIVFWSKSMFSFAFLL